MTAKALKAIEKHFGQITDPRVDRTKEHKLVDIIAIALCAVICDSTAKRVVPSSKPKKFNILSACSEKTPNTNSPH